MIKKRAIFLDRDGVINKKAKEHDYIKNWGEFEFLPHVRDVISQLNKKFLVEIFYFARKRLLARKQEIAFQSY